MTRIQTTGPLPQYARPGDAGADLIATEETWLMPGKFATVSTSTSVEIPAGHFGLVAGQDSLSGPTREYVEKQMAAAAATNQGERESR